MRFFPARVLLSALLLSLALSAGAAADDVTLSGVISFNSLDGSADDHDGAANGVFTVNDGNLVIDGTVQCNDDPPFPGSASACPMRFAVSGDLVLNAGAAVFAENRRSGGNGGAIRLDIGGDLIVHGPAGGLPGALISSSRISSSTGVAGSISATVEGDVVLQAGSTVAASNPSGHAGNIEIEADGGISVAGVIAAGPGRNLLANRWVGPVLSGGVAGQVGGSISLRSTSTEEPGIRIETQGVVASQSESSGMQLVLLEACGIEVRGLVAAVSKDPNASRVALRSGKTILVDGRDLANLGASGRWGRVRSDSTKRGAAGYLVDLFAEGKIQVLGPVSGSTDVFSVSANPGDQPVQPARGAVTVISLTGSVVARGQALESGRWRPGEKGGIINVKASGDADLDGAQLRAVGDYSSTSSTRQGGQIFVRSYQGEIRWNFGKGDVRPTGSLVPAAMRGTISLTACSGIDVTGTSFPVQGSPTAPFPAQTDGVCSPAAPSLPPGESPLIVCGHPPVADDQSVTTSEDTPATVTLTGSDPDGHSLTFSILSGPTHGTLGALTSPTPTSVQVMYTPAADFSGSDSFTFQVDNGNGGTDTGTVSITVQAHADEAPTAVADSATVPEDAPATSIDVLANDTDPDDGPKSIASVTQPANGIVAIAGDGLSLTYKPVADYCNTPPGTALETFTYTLSPAGSTPTATVTVSVTCVDDAPSAVADTATVPEDAPATSIDVLANDTDADGGSKSIASVTQPAHGMVAITGGGSGLTYQPSPEYCDNPSGTFDTFTYTLSPAGANATAIVSVSVTCVNDAPSLANPNVTYTVLGNTQLRVGETTAGTGLLHIRDNQDVLEKSVPSDVDGPGPITVVPFSGNTGKGDLVLNADGTFTYEPNAGFEGTDVINFQVTDNGSPAAVKTGTITITVAQMVWFVRDVTDGNNPEAGDTGRSTNAFEVLADAAAAATPDDYIFVFAGESATTPYGGVRLNKSGLKLIGEGVGLSVPGFDNLIPAGPQPHVANTTDVPGQEDNGVVVDATAGTLNGIEIRGLNILGRDNGIEVNAAGANSAGVTIRQNTVSSDGATGLEGIDVNANSTGVVTAAVTENSLSGRGNAFDARSTAGTLQINFSDNANVLSNASGVVIDGSGGGTLVITGFANNSIHPGTAGTGISIANATFNLVSGGNTTVGVPGDGVGGAGMVMTGVQGNLSFADLDIFADGGAGLRVSGAGGGMTLNVSPNVGMVEATGGPAVDVTGVALSLPLTSLKSTNSATTGVALNGVSGTFSAGSGSSITGTSGTGLQVGSSSASVTYNGTITTATGKGVDLTSNSGTISFTGTLNLNSGTNIAFNATGGGTVTSTDTASTLTSTTGTALNVANTTIGSPGLKFRSVSVNGAPSGIVLNNTGSSGGLTVSGAGVAGSGGTIQNTTSHGISLAGTMSPSFHWMSIQSTAGSGINGTQVTHFAFTDGTINTSGTGLGAETSNIAFNTTAAGTENNLSGAVTITGNTLSNAYYHGIDIFNFNGTISDATITGNTITSANSIASSKGSGIRLIAFGSATAAASVTKATIANNIISNFPSAAGIMAQGGNGNAAGPAGVFGTAGSGSNIIAITGNRVAGFSAASRIGTQAILAVVNGKGQGNFDISSNGTVANPLTNTVGTTVALSSLGQAVVTANVSNNVVVANNTAGANGIGAGTSQTFGSGDTPNLTVTIVGNQISQTDGNGILVTARDATGTVRAKIQNNTVAAPLAGNRNGIRVDAGNAVSVNDTICLNISANTSAGVGLAPEGIGLRKQGTTAGVNNLALQGFSTSPATQAQTAAQTTSQNPGSSSGTLVISGDNFNSPTCSFP